jgi:hypothetical protein
MHRSIHRFAVLLLAGGIVGLGGCQMPGFGRKPVNATQSADGVWTVTPGEADSSTSSTDQIPSLTPPPNAVAGTGGGSDPVAAVRSGLRMDVWAISVPRGAVSANESFWKRVDENAVSPQRYELLFVNGFRVGVGRADQWEYFRDLLSRHPARHQLNAVMVYEETNVEVPVRRGVEVQTLGFFGESGLELKTFDKSDNLLALSFLPAPRRPDAARVAMTPIVRSLRDRLQTAEVDGETRLRTVAPERLYDLSLAVEVPFGQFLVVSPSTDTARQTSIGRNFLLFDKDAEQNELVLLIVPSKAELRPDTRPSALNQRPESSGNAKPR